MEKSATNILVIEDDDNDFILIAERVESACSPVNIRRAVGLDEVKSELTKSDLSAVLTDYKLPGYTGADVLKLKEIYCPDVPLIVVTGALEDCDAAEIMKSGADDYVFKTGLQRLPHALLRELRDVDTREKKRIAEKKLRDTGNKYRLLFNNTGDAVFVWSLLSDGKPGKCVEFNDAACKLSSLSADELYGIDRSALFKSDSSGAGLTPGVLTEEILTTRKGDTVYVETTACEFEEYPNRFMLTSVRNISKRKEAEAFKSAMIAISSSAEVAETPEALSEKIGEILEPLLGSGDIFVVEYDAATAGLKPVYSTGNHDEEMQFALSPDYTSCMKVINARRPVILEKSDFTTTGEVIKRGHNLNCIGVPMIGDGSVIGIFGVRSKSPGTFFNESQLELTAFAAQRMAVSISKYYSSAEIRRMNAELEDKVKKRTLSLNEALQRFEQTNSDLRAANKKLIDESQKLKDLSARHIECERLLQEFNSALEQRIEERTIGLMIEKDKAEETNRLSTIILGNIGHELRTPLNGILGTIQFMKTGLLSEDEFEEAIEMMYDAASRLNNTITALLGLIEIESGQRNIYPESVRLGTGVENFFEGFVSSMKKNDVELKLDIEDDKIMCNLDESLLYQSLYHLVENAVKFTSQGTVVITVGSTGDGDIRKGFIRVSDTGKGIGESDLHVIFQPFRQASEGIARSNEGIGIGLTIASKSAELMGGKIDAESKVGVGSRFTISFPGYYS